MSTYSSYTPRSYTPSDCHTAFGRCGCVYTPGSNCPSTCPKCSTGEFCSIDGYCVKGSAYSTNSQTKFNGSQSTCIWVPNYSVPCNATCNGTSTTSTGTKTVNYIKIREATDGGSCDQPTAFTEPCTKTDCPVNCDWNIGSWGNCEASCDKVNTTRPGTRTRNVTKIRSAINGGSCTTPSNSEPCTKTDCPVDCAWDVREWGKCNAKCNGTSSTSTGTKTRDVIQIRSAANGGICTTPSNSEPCTKTDCPVDCAWVPNYSVPCNATCNGTSTTSTGTKTVNYIKIREATDG
jgi:hypothetical protein